MNHWLLGTALAAGMSMALPLSATAQFPPPPPPAASPAPVQERWPQAAPPRSAPAQQQPQQQPAQAAPAPRRAAAPANVVTCSGVFGRQSTHLKLAMRFDSRNIVFGQVDGPEGTRLNASILYPSDARRRLEVIWHNDAGRSDTSLVVINGKSQWTAPKGLRLGLPLAALEKTNGRPFKLSAFGKDGIASVAGWEGGGLSVLPGGCKVGIRLAADDKTPEAARNAVSGDKELMSNDPALRAVKAKVIEILIGY